MMLRTLPYAIGLGLAAAAAAQPTSYVIVDLGTLGPAPTTGSPGSQAFGIDAAGTVVGHSILVDGEPDLHAFRWDGTLHELPPLPGDPHSMAFAVNDTGMAVGISYEYGELVQRGVRWIGSTIQPVGSFEPRDVNNAGVIVGEQSATFTGAYGHAVRFSGGVLTDLGTFGGRHSSAYAVNDAGGVVGASFLTGDLLIHAFYWAEGIGLHDLGTLGGPRSHALDVNDALQVVGVADTAAGVPHAVLYALNAAGGVLSTTDLGTLDGGFSAANAINGSGDVVGNSDGRAVRWAGGGAIEDLNALIPSGADWILATATAINDDGQIAGWGMHAGRPRAFRLTPGITGDVDGDGHVDVTDLVALILAWGPCPPAPAACPSDFDGNGAVDVADLVALILNWGA